MARKKALKSGIPALAIIAALAAVFSFACDVAAATEIMKVGDVRVGMKGIGKTVVHGFKIEEFDVEILGVLKNNKLDDSLQISGSSFLVRVSGDVIDLSGGVAAGMSGSPVYIGGKLVGAVSSGWVMADHTIGLLTPIEEMLGLFRYMRQDGRKAVDPAELIDRDAMLFIEKSPLVPDRFLGVRFAENSADKRNGDRYMIMEKASTPLFVSGLNGRNFARLAEGVKRAGLASVSLVDSKGVPADATASFDAGTLAPGHAIAAQLVRGDINVTAIGTLTYLDAGRFLAFGHSFLKKGRAGYFFTPANIYHCFNSAEMPFKIGAPGDPIGSVAVDRNEGLAGSIGVMPRVISVHASVRDLDNGSSREFSTQVINDNALFPELLQSIITQSIDEGINRQGEGFAKAAYTMRGRSEKSGEFNIRRVNYFYDPIDIATACSAELAEVTKTLTGNHFEKVMLLDVTISFDVAEKNPSARITSASIGRNDYRIGESIEVSVCVEPYFKNQFIENFEVPVPANLAEGQYKLLVRNAAYAPSACIDPGVFSESGKDSLEMRVKKSASTFRGLMEKINSTERNNQICVEFVPFSGASEKNDEMTHFDRKDGADRSHRGHGHDGRGEKKNDGRKPGEIREKPGSGTETLGRLVASLSDIGSIISDLRSKVTAGYAPADPENIKFFRAVECVVEPFETGFDITVGDGASLFPPEGRDAEAPPEEAENFPDEGPGSGENRKDDFRTGIKR